MGNSLEVRVPFLDKDSVAYAWDNIPLQLNDNDALKKVLKETLAIYYPKKIIQTDKKGFSVPIEDWLRNELKDNVQEYIFQKPFYGEDHINITKVKGFVTDFFDRKHNNGWGVWHIYAWQKWAYTHVID